MVCKEFYILVWCLVIIFFFLLFNKFILLKNMGKFVKDIEISRNFSVRFKYFLNF